MTLRPGTGKIYKEREVSKNTYVREFPSFTHPKQLKWHMDDENRLIRPLHKTDWKIQLEDELPVPLNDPIFIERHQWHRLIKGKGSLTIKVTKNANRA